MEALAAAIVTGVVTLTVCMLNNHYQSNQTRSLLEYKLDELTKRVDKHNSLIERTYQLEKVTDLQAEQIKVVNHRISVLEEREIK